MLLKSCNRCGVLVPYGSTFCPRCTPIAEEEKQKRIAEARALGNRRYNQQRDKKYTRFYNSAAWRNLAAVYAQDKGYRCETCGAIAQQVHHIEPIQTASGWTRRLDYNNLRLLCLSCHNKVHNRFVEK